MANDLIGLVQGVLNSSVVDQMGKVVGEPTAKTQAAVSGAVPAVLAGVLKEMGSSPAGAGHVLSLTHNGFDRVVGNLPSMLGGGSGSVDQLMGMGKHVLGSLFGDKLPAVSGALAGSTGVSESSATSILGMAAPAVMGMLGRQLGSNPSPSGLLGLLSSSKDAIARFAPAGLLGALGFRNVDELTRRASGMVEQTKSAAGRSWVPLVAVAAAILVGFLAYQNCTRHTLEGATTGARQLSAVTLPGGSTLNVEQNGFLYNLTRYLASPEPTPKTFVFDHLNFESGGTTLTPDSGSTVTDLTRVLNAYPSAQVKLVGFTDTTGDSVRNTALSLARANAVADLLSNGGVARSRVTTEGLGSTSPVASNDTEEGRARNRRIELTVVQK